MIIRSEDWRDGPVRDEELSPAEQMWRDIAGEPFHGFSVDLPTIGETREYLRERKHQLALAMVELQEAGAARAEAKRRYLVDSARTYEAARYVEPGSGELPAKKPRATNARERDAKVQNAEARAEMEAAETRWRMAIMGVHAASDLSSMEQTFSSLVREEMALTRTSPEM